VGESFRAPGASNWCYKMATRENDMLTYGECEKMLGKRGEKGSRDAKKVAHNTWLERCGPDYTVRLHRTVVVVIHQDGTYTLNAAEYRTTTTKDRIRRFGPASLCQKKFVWYVAGVPFHDGIRVDAVGHVIG
jgi:hypothetical protein